jgi:hypothetical protein
MKEAVGWVSPVVVRLDVGGVDHAEALLLIRLAMPFQRKLGSDSVATALMPLIYCVLTLAERIWCLPEKDL